MLQGLFALILGAGMFMAQPWARREARRIVDHHGGPTWIVPTVLVGYVLLAAVAVVLGALELAGVDTLAE